MKPMGLADRGTDRGTPVRISRGLRAGAPLCCNCARDAAVPTYMEIPPVVPGPSSTAALQCSGRRKNASIRSGPLRTWGYM